MKTHTLGSALAALVPFGNSWFPWERHACHCHSVQLSLPLDTETERLWGIVPVPVALCLILLNMCAFSWHELLLLEMLHVVQPCMCKPVVKE